MTIAKLLCCCISLIVVASPSKEKDFFRLVEDPDGSMYLSLKKEGTTLLVLSVPEDEDGHYGTALSLEYKAGEIQVLDANPALLSEWLGPDGARTAVWELVIDVIISLDIDCDWNPDGTRYCCGIAGADQGCIMCVYRKGDGSMGDMTMFCKVL